MGSFCRRHFLLRRSRLGLSLFFGDRLGRRFLALGFKESLELAEGAQGGGSLECGLGKLRLGGLTVRLARPGRRGRRSVRRCSRALAGPSRCGSRGMLRRRLRRRRGGLPLLAYGNLRLLGLRRASAARRSRWALRVRRLRLALLQLEEALLEDRWRQTLAWVAARPGQGVENIAQRGNAHLQPPAPFFDRQGVQLLAQLLALLSIQQGLGGGVHLSE